MGYIYKVTNTTNGNIYIGQTTRTPQVRWNQHQRDAFYPNREDYNTKFHRAIRKYGVDSFTCELVERCCDDSLNDREMYWISFFDTFNTKHGYNCTSGGGSDFCVSSETRKKISESKSGERNHYYGKHLTKEHREKIGNSQRGALSHMYGKHHTDEQIAMVKIAESIPLVAYTDDDGIYKYFLSSMAAMRSDSIDCSHISHCLNGKNHRKSAGKSDNGKPLRWRHASDEETMIIKRYYIATKHEVILPKEYQEFKEDISYANGDTDL